jgi:trk system potassium uptake protein TrkH
MSHTARILYAIYAGMTAVLIILLLCGGMPIFESIVHSLALAGTGGFGAWGNSIAHYDSTYVNVVMSVFMLLFSKFLQR